LEHCLESLDTALSAGPITADFDTWRAQVAALRADWLAAGPLVRDETLDQAQIEWTVGLVCAILALVERHPSLAPGHGESHARRVTVNGMVLAMSENLTVPDAARLVLACSSHDLGRLALTKDLPQLRHAEVSGVLVDRHLRAALEPLGTGIFLGVREAVLSHTFAPPAEELYLRVLDDLRICDGLDCNGTGAGLVRSAINAASVTSWGPDLSLEPGKPEYGWLSDWRFRCENPWSPPVRLSAWGRAERHFRHGAGRDLIRSMAGLDGDSAIAGRLLAELVVMVEPDANPSAIEKAAKEIMALPDRERGRWTGVLTRVRRDCLAETRDRKAILGVMVDEAGPLLGPLAARLLERETA
jgi:hypothetical protein